jgi:NAD dependent epimerase/dehydratase family enzyme
VPSTAVTQRPFLDATADTLGVTHPGSVPPVLAALVAGRVNAEVMTLHATCTPAAPAASGFRFAHEDVRAGIAAALSSTNAPVHA